MNRNGNRVSLKIVWLALAAALGVAVCAMVFAQGSEQGTEKPPAPAPVHDISGTWALRAPRGAGFSWYNYALMADEPPMTPWAEEKFKQNRPSFGPHPQEDSNDPAYSCMPNGVPRVYAFVQASMQIIQQPGRARKA